MEKSINIERSPKKEIHFLDYFIVLAKNGRIIICPTLMVMVLTYLCLVLLPNEYTSVAILLPPQEKLNLSAQILDSLKISTSPGATASALGGMVSALGMRSPGELYVGVLNSYTLMDRIIERFKLKQRYGVRYIEEARLKLLRYARSRAEKNGLIIIEATDKDPQMAADMANALCEELDKLLREVAQEDAKKNLAFLEQERSEAIKKLLKDEETLRCFSEKTSVINLDAQSRGMITYIAKLRAEIDAKEVYYQVLRQRATESNYDAVFAETEINSLKEKLRAAEGQMNQHPSGEVCIATSQMPTIALEYFRLIRETKYQEIIYQLYCKLAELARIDLARNVPVARVLSRAVPAQKRSNQRLPWVLLAGGLACMTMISLAFFQEYWRHNRSEEDSERLTLLFHYVEPWFGGFKKLFSFFRRAKTSS